MLVAQLHGLRVKVAPKHVETHLYIYDTCGVGVGVGGG